MKALFVHDHIFYKFEGEYYSPGSFPSNVWQRFFVNNIVSELKVVTRGVKLSERREGLVLSSAPNVNFSPLFDVSGGAEYYLKSRLIKRHLFNLIKSVDVVIIRAPSSFGELAYSICRQLSKPYVTEVVGCALDSTLYSGRLIIKALAPLKYVINRRIVKNSHASLYVTKKFLQARYPSEASISSYASNVYIQDPNDVTLQKRIEIINIESDDKVFKIGMLANISVRYKGFDVAIRSLKELRTFHPELSFKLYIAGGGSPSYINKVLHKHSMQDKVVLVGLLQSGSQVLDFLDSLDIYIHPSKTEGLPRAVIEAMSRGCPVLASSVGGLPELIDSRFLHKAGDFNKLKTDIQEALSSRVLRVSMAKSNFQRSMDYTDSILKVRRERFYQAALSII